MGKRDWRSALVALAVSASHLAAGQPRLDVVRTLEGNGDVRAAAMAVDRSGNIYIAGSTSSSDLATSGAFQTKTGSASIHRYVGAAAPVPPRYPRSRVDRDAVKFRPVYPPTNAQVIALAVDPGQPSTVYGATSRGLLKTTDNGDTWATLSNGLPADRRMGTVVVAASDANVVYAGVGGSDVYKSTDAGATWRRVAPHPCGTCNFLADGLVVDPANASRLFAFGGFRSTDGGMSWQQLALTVDGVAFDSRRKDTIYAFGPALGGRRPFKSVDGGDTWFETGNTGTLPFGGIIFPDPSRPGTVYLGVFGAFAKSTDDGGNFQLLTRDFGPSQIVAMPGTGILYATAHQGSLPSYIVIRSDDGFRTYSTVGSPLDSPSTLGITPAGTLFAGSNFRPDLFVTKLNPAGEIIFTTYVGGSQGEDASAIAVDSRGDIYVAGITDSPDFPFTASLGDGTASATVPFILKLSSDGRRLLFATRLGGATDPFNPSPTIRALALDPSGSIYLAGEATGGLPTTPGVVQPQFGGNLLARVKTTAFAAKLGPDGKTLLYSTYLGGSGDAARALAIDRQGNAYVAGTRIWKLNPTGTRLLRDTEILRANSRAVVLDDAGNLYLCGSTTAPDFPVSPGAFQTTPPPFFGPPFFTPAARDAFVAKLDAAGQILYSTLLGGESTEAAVALVVDGEGNATVGGTTQSLAFPTRSPIRGPFSGNNGFVARLNRGASDALYSTYLGDERQFVPVALAPHPAGGILLAGYTPGAESIVARIVEDGGVLPVRADAVLNSASLVGGPVAPGEFIKIRGAGFGPDARVSLRGEPLSIVSVGATEIEAVAPETFAPGGGAELRVESGGRVSNPVLVNTANVSPGIYTQDGSGRGQALAFNEDGARNSQAAPASRGSTITIVANGLGRLTEAHLTVGIGSLSPEVVALQLGPAPGLPGGGHQLIKVALIQNPPSPAPGDVSQVFLSLIMGDTPFVNPIISQPGVTIWVR